MEKTSHLRSPSRTDYRSKLSGSTGLEVNTNLALSVPEPFECVMKLRSEKARRLLEQALEDMQ